MMKYGFITLGVLFCLHSFTQSIYGKVTYKNFREYSEFNEVVNPKNFKPEILNAAIFFATNEIRSKKRLSILDYHPLLEAAATLHSEEMVNKNFFGHTNKKNKRLEEPEDRAKVAGIVNASIAENVMEGFIINYKSGDKVVAQGPGEFSKQNSNQLLPAHTYLTLADQLLANWMNSKGHRANILSNKAVQLGCGTAFYKMQNFNDMPAVKATQNFQWFHKVKSR
ncbi:MAG: CAP domain-containing protein [Candidatus Scalindua sp. AMX11]|nr:MAG: CAP domain-containing protein [Candidatus Scalindua sp.]NOG82381.1 CAP domain-containing protein [Planctomycetota bacterium]RZV70582.1 MAG: CAP domain-containing protein [Candidatus Scalindua sp. SCAELEC01]TDE64187.1 MAG: CAP domain-containing protein [Candidatus Scalindua sp. AMX11]GJQ60460.1 MAG: hypothetical protein SCALA701_32610 [Candidatus Scalindua sp.]